jgi:hypothetical protein
VPFVTPTVRRRILITGETGSGKTHSLRSFPSPKFIMVYPGEKGQDTLLKSDGSAIDADTVVRVWEHGDKPLNSTEVIEQVRKATLEALRTPGLVCFCGDGLHKLYEYVMDAMSGGEYFAGSPFKTETRDDKQVVDPRVPMQAEHWITDYLSVVALSRVPYAVFTAWDKDTGVRRAKTLADGKKEKWTDIPTFKMPAFYSAAARKVLGEFGCCLHASVSVKRMDVGGGKWEARRLYQWQTQPDNEVGACAIKGEGEKVKLIPKFIGADWKELAKYVERE